MRPLLPIALLAVLGCYVGTSAKKYGPARGPAGAAVAIELYSGPLGTVELLAVETDHLLVLQERELVRIPIRLIASAKAPKVSFKFATLPSESREKLRLISRYPQGVTNDLEARLLDAYKQQSVRVAS